MFNSMSLLATVWMPGGGIPWLSLVTFFPILGAIALMLVPKIQSGVHRNIALVVSILTGIFSLGILFNFDAGVALADSAFTYQLQEGPVPWVESLGIHYAVGIDGISLWLVVLTTFLMPIAIASTFGAVTKNVKEYMISLLLLEAGMIGALVANDVFLFYIFWEVMLIPMYLIIGIWGGEDRVKAAVKFFIYTMVGSLLMLIAILYVYFKVHAQTGTYSFLLQDMLAADFSATEQIWLAGAFLLAFAIKVPLFPFHTWLPLAHVQAPTAGSVILAGVLLKMGTYGMVRFAFPMFPDAIKIYAPLIALLAVIGIVYGALVALVQDDIKKLVAYSSVSHLGFCVLGLVSMTPQGLAGGMFIMLAHGIATGGLFLSVGILYERRHTKKIAAFGGVAKSMPIFAAMFLIILFASVGLPGLNGFVGEFLALVGTAKSQFLWHDAPIVFQVVESAGAKTWAFGATDTFPLPTNIQAGGEYTAYFFVAIASSGVIFAAGYLLWMYRRVMFGPLTLEANKNLKDLNGRELAYLTPIVLMCIFMGVYPQFFLGRMEPSLNQFLTYMHSETQDTTAKIDLTEEELEKAKSEDPTGYKTYRTVQMPNVVVVQPIPEGWVPKGKITDKKEEGAK